MKLKSKPISEDTAQRFEELCERFPEVFSKNSEDIGKTNLITMDIDTGDHPPICQKPYTLAISGCKKKLSNWNEWGLSQGACRLGRVPL